jgi:hypothetical protein
MIKKAKVNTSRISHASLARKQFWAMGRAAIDAMRMDFISSNKQILKPQNMKSLLSNVLDQQPTREEVDLFCLAVSDANISGVVDPQELTFDHLYIFLKWNAMQSVASNNKGEDTQIEEEEQQRNLVHLFQRKALAAKRSNNLKLAIEYTKTYRQLQLLKNKDDSLEPSAKEESIERVLKTQPRRNMKEHEKRKRKGQRNEKPQKGKKKYPEIVLESSNLTSIVPITVEEPTKNQIKVTKTGKKAEKKGNINTDEQIKVLTKEKIAETTETKKQKIGAKVEANVERKGPVLVAKNMEVGKKLDQLNSNALQLEKQMKEYVKSIQSALTSIGKPTLDSFRSAGLEKGATGLKSKVIKHLLKKLGLPLPNKSQIKGESLLFLVSISIVVTVCYYLQQLPVTYIIFWFFVFTK